MIKELYKHFLQHPSVCTDTREIRPGSIFFALKGASFNGNRFAEQALEGGCSLAVIDEAAYKKDERYVLVPDVLEALQQLAAHHRKALGIPVIGITGSNGKTTSKELIHAVLSKKYNVLATKGNLNNHIGVPLTLLSLNEKHEMAIVEMGANHQGEIAMLCGIADPDFGIITNIGKAHLEGFGGIEGVKKGKSELYRYIQEKKARLPDGRGKLFVHGDDEVLIELAGATEKVTYGTKKLYDIVGRLHEEPGSEFIAFQWATRYNAAAIKNSTVVRTKLVGIYNYYNLLCAACVGNYFKLSDEQINQALAEYTPSNNRSQLEQKGSNTLILDYYNANPSSMSLALENFAALKKENKMAVLGDMLELGEESAAEHLGVLDLLKKLKLEKVILVGPLFMEAAKGAGMPAFLKCEEAAAYLKEEKIRNATVLIKGSRGIQLEKVLSAFE